MGVSIPAAPFGSPGGGWNIASGYDAAHHSIATAIPSGGGGRAISGIGPLSFYPTLMIRTLSFFTYDWYEGAMIHANFDARVYRFTSSVPDKMSYRDEWGNVLWLTDDGADSELGAGKQVFRSIARNDSSSISPGAFVVIIYDGNNPTTPYEMKYPDGGSRLFNSQGWVVKDLDRNGNAIIYTRDANHYVTKIKFPTSGSAVREANVIYQSYVIGGATYKRFWKIEIPNDITYEYSYTGTSLPFFLNRVVGREAVTNNIVLDISYNYETYQSISLPEGYYDYFPPTALERRLVSIRDNISNQIVVKYGYDGGYNLPYEVKRIGYEDAAGNNVWLISRPSSDYSGYGYSQGSADEGVLEFPNHGKLVFYLDPHFLFLEQLFYEEFEDAPPIQSLTIDNPSEYYDVFNTYLSNFTENDYWPFPNPENDGQLLEWEEFFTQFSDDYHPGAPNYPDYPAKSLRMEYDYFFDYNGNDFPDMGVEYPYVDYDGDKAKHFMAGSRLTDYTAHHHMGDITAHFEYDVTKWSSPLTKAVLDYNYNNIVSSFTYDANGNLLTATDPLNYTSTYTYYSNGNLHTAASPLGKTVSFAYNDYGDLVQITDPASRTVSMTYNPANSDLLSITGPLNYTFSFLYDSLHRPTQGKGPDNEVLWSAGYVDGPSQTYTYTDGNGKKTLVDFDPKYGATKPRIVLKNAYQTAQERTTTITLKDHFDLDRVDYPDGSYAAFGYDKMHKVTSAGIYKGADSIQSAIRTDSSGALRQVTVTNNDPRDMATGSRSTSYAYQSDMMPESMTDWDGNSTTLAYDPIGRIDMVTRTLGNGQSVVQQYQYNNAGQIIGNYFISNGIYLSVAGYSYNKDGQVKLISRACGSACIVTLFDYNPQDGRLQKIEHYRDPGYDTTYGPETDTYYWTQYDTLLCRLTYTYDAEGKILNRSRQFYNNYGQLQRTAKQYFTYNKLGRLTSEQYDFNDAAAPAYDLTRLSDYDLAGNRTQKHTQGSTATYSYDNLHQVTNENGGVYYTYTHDALGNLTGIAGGVSKSLAWNLAGNLAQVGGVQYAYDDSGTGLLAERRIGGTTTKYFWEGYHLFLEKVGSTPLRVYLNHPGGGGAICRLDLGDGVLDYSDEVYIYLHDEAGNVIGVTDKYGYLAIEYEQDVWGNDLIGNFNTPVNGAAILQHQSGKVWDAEAGMYSNAARWYDPRIGRFVSRSPLAPEGEEEYAFCGNDPVNYVDQNGEVPVLIFIAGAWYVIEWGLSAYDAYDTYNTISDPCAEAWEKWTSGIGFAAGVLLPGGGYGKGTKVGAEAVHGTKFWKIKTTFNGRQVFQRDDLFDPFFIGEDGFSNIQRMRYGNAPLGFDGNPINLHHMIQTDSGSLAEVSQTFHQRNGKILNINGNNVPSSIDRPAFNAWKSDYWMNRADDF